MLFGKKSRNKNVYRLKTMAGVRVVSEIGALLLFFFLPFILLASGLFASFDLVVKLAVVLGALFAGLLLPVYCFITWQITLEEDGIIGWSLVKRRKLSWQSLTKLTRKSNFNWQRYVLEYDGGDLTFPLWFERCDNLVALIRERLPQNLSPRDSGPQLFIQDTISYFMQVFQVSFGLILTAVASYFASYLLTNANNSVWDALLVIVFTLVLSLSMFFRAITVALMPRRITVNQDCLELDTVFFKKRITWSKIEQLKASNPFLPEGYLLETSQGTFLIGTGFDALDELVEGIRENVKRVREG